MNVIGVLSAVKSFQVTDSVKAGGSAAILVYAFGAILTAIGVIIPPISIFGIQILATATPITLGLSASAAAVVGQVVTAYAPDSVKQHIDALASKLPALQATLPGVYGQPTDYPNAPTGENLAPGTTNLQTKAAMAVTVIQAHA